MSLLLPTRSIKNTKEDKRSNFPLARQSKECRLLDWLPLTPMWIQYLKFSRPHDQYFVHDGVGTGMGTRWISQYSTWSTSLDRPETTLLLSDRDQQRLRLHVHMPAWKLCAYLSICPHRPQGTITQAIQGVRLPQFLR